MFRQSVGALVIDRRSQRREAVDQFQLPGEDAPVKRIVAGRVTRLRQAWLSAQDGADLPRMSGDDRFLQRIELGRVVPDTLFEVPTPRRIE